MNAIYHLFGATYLQEPTLSNLKRHIEINTTHGFPNMFGILDCMH